MNNNRNRKYPRAAKKETDAQEESILNISAGTALGILGVTFAQGIALGYFFRKRFR